jgi:CheY-like chemotaxis protein
VETTKTMLRVLLVDDDLFLLRRMQRCMRLRPGVELLAFANPVAVLESVAEVRPDIIVLDCNMPMLNGIEMCRRIKRMPELVDVPIVLVTASISTAIEKAAADAGAVRALEKPMNMMDFAQQITSIETAERMRLRREIDAAKQQLQAGADTLGKLRDRCLARGTRDVAEQARMAHELARGSDALKFS